jgi:hypothetical protein
MPYFLIFLKALPYILALVKAVEPLFPGKGTGPQKKAAVLDAAKIIIEGGTEISTGGQKETWQNVGPLISTAIDLAAGVIFPNKPSPPDAG